MDFCVIYLVVNVVNGKQYVGQSWNPLHRRWLNHCTNKGCIRLYNAIHKYGRDKFTISLLTITHTQETADYWEAHFIRKFNTINSGYNIREGGSRGKVSDSTKKKMSAWQIGRKLSDEHKANVSKARMGMKPSEETRKKLSIARKGNQNALGGPGGRLLKGSTWKLVNGKRAYTLAKDKL